MVAVEAQDIKDIDFYIVITTGFAGGLFLSPIKRLKIRQFPLFHNPRSLLFVAMLAHRYQVAELIRSTSILGDKVVNSCLFECERLAALCAETVGLFEDYAFCGQFLLLLGSHV